MSLRIAIVIPVLNNFRGCIDMLETIKSQHNTKVIIMPNYIHNHCLSKSWNDGIQIGRDWGADVIGVFNDDLIFAPTTVDIMAETLVEYTQLRDNGFLDPKRIIGITGTNMRGQVDPMQLRADETFREKEKIIGIGGDFSCFMVTPGFLDKVGGFDVNFRPAYHEDIDMHYRMRLLGYEFISSSQAIIYHHGSVTQKNVSGGACSSEMFNKGKDYLHRKWNGLTWKNPYNNPNLSPKEWILDA